MDETYEARLRAAMENWNRGGTSDKAQHLFNLYNEGNLGPREGAHTCGGCVARVVGIVSAWLAERG